MTDAQQWALFRQEHKVDEKTKVFTMTGGYAPVKEALLSRGWVENPDPESICFDLKVRLKLAKCVCKAVTLT